MDPDHLEQLKQRLGQLSPGEQDLLAGFLLVERLKRNSLIMPALCQRIEDADPENWGIWNKPQASPSDE